MNEGTQSEIASLLNSPTWWFAQVVVALLVNILASAIYEALRPRLGWIPGKLLLAACVVHAIMIAWSIWWVPVSGHYAREMLPVFGLLLAGLIVVNYFMERPAAVVSLISFAIFFPMALGREFVTLPAAQQFSWQLFFSNYFYVACLITAVTVIVRSLQVMRAKRTLKRTDEGQ